MARGVRSVRDRILYEYAKLIVRSAVGGRPGRDADRSEHDRYWGMLTAKYSELCSGEISPSSILRENKALVEQGSECAYCGSFQEVQWEHLIPLSDGGPDTIDNQVRACRSCNSSKGAKDLVVWWSGREEAIPRLVLGKYLKLLWERHDENGTLGRRFDPEGHPVALVSLHMRY